MIDPALHLLLERLHEVECPLLTRKELIATDGDIDALLQTKVLRRTEDLAEIQYDDGTWMAVRDFPTGIHGVAADRDDYFDPVPLDEDAVIAYEVNVPALTKVICDSNDISGPNPQEYFSPVYLGLKSMGGWGMLEVYMAFPAAEIQDVRGLFSSLRPQEQNHMIGLLVPVPLAMESGLVSILSANSIVPIPMSEHIATATFSIDWPVAVGARVPSLSPSEQQDSLNRLETRDYITTHFVINDETIRRYDKKGKTPNGKPWTFTKDPNDKRRKLYSIRMVYDALGCERMKAEYRRRGEKALAEVLDSGETEDSTYQVRKKADGFMHT